MKNFFDFLKEIFLPILTVINTITLVAILFVEATSVIKMDSQCTASSSQVSEVFDSSDVEYLGVPNTIAEEYNTPSVEAAFLDSISPDDYFNTSIESTTATSSSTITTTTTTVVTVKVIPAKTTIPVKEAVVQTLYSGSREQLLTDLEQNFHCGQTLIIKNVPTYDEYFTEHLRIKDTNSDWEYVLAIRCADGKYEQSKGRDNIVGDLVYAHKNFNVDDTEFYHPCLNTVMRIGDDYYASEAIIAKLLEGISAPAHYESVNVWTAPKLLNE